MHAVTISRFGGPEVLSQVELPDPHPETGQISIDVTHAAVGMIDVIFRRGDRANDDRFPPPPFVPGIEVAGFVREVGDGVNQFTVGERVVTLSLMEMGGYQRLIDEGLRMEDHPGIVFRDGPSGRRAGLAAGPDVWEVIETLKGTNLTGEAAIAATAEWGVLALAQVRLALRYYGDFRDEIDERIALNQREAARHHAAFERAREALA
ncbi:MAG: alcohol dehydrogenase catalytic domain-containing protein [Solirubrobacteraceae bacterium]